MVLNFLNKRTEKGKITQEEMDKIGERITGSSQYKDLAECDLIIEAAAEDMDLKINIFSDLSSVCSSDAILVSNKSTFLIEKLMAGVDNPARTAGLHYFFPANVNRLVEVIRQKNSSDDTYQALMDFAGACGKVAIIVKDFPGFAINPLFISSFMVLDSFYGEEYNVATLEDISKKALGIKFGIMWVQNSTGLNTCYHAGTSMHKYLRDGDVGYPVMPEQLKDQFHNGTPWDLEDGAVDEDEGHRRIVRDRLLGTIFTVATHLIEKEVVSVNDLELGVCTALAWPKGPFALMNELGMDETMSLVQLAVDSGDFKMPEKFSSENTTQWKL